MNGLEEHWRNRLHKLGAYPRCHLTGTVKINSPSRGSRGRRERPDYWGLG